MATTRIARYTGNDIYKILKNDILSLKLKPGQVISENEISSEFNVSRTPVHSAFTQLKADGLVDILPQRGTVVSLLDLDFINQIIFMRAQVEVGVCTEAAQLCDDHMIAQMEENLRQQKAFLDQQINANLDFYTLSDEFHCLFYKLTGKEKLWNCIKSLQYDYMRYRVVLMDSRKQCMKAYEEHKFIAEMVRTKNIEGIRHFIPLHLDTVLPVEELSEYGELFY